MNYTLPEIQVIRGGQALYSRLIKDITSADNIRVWFKASGIPSLDEKASPDEVRSYLQTCETGKVLPQSVGRAEFDAAQGKFVVRAQSKFFRGVELKTDIAAASVLDPRRVESFGVFADKSAAFPIFREQFLDEIMSRGYEINDGEFWLTSHYTPPHGINSGGYFANTELLIGRGAKARFEVEGAALHHYVWETDENRLRLDDWFTRLKDQLASK